MKFKQKKIAAALACVMGAGGASLLPSTPAVAQDIKVEVTGSNIRRVDAETPSEVQVITSQQMIESGYTSVSQILRDLTANGNGTLSQSFSRSFAGGGSAVALRGLGVGATLILIDGYKMAGYPRADDGQRNFVDISSIPFVAVDRIEVLLDGASAIYGSDAIAGVVNVILKKDYKGTYANATAGTTTKGGGTTVDAQILQGFGDISAGLGGYFALEYRNQDAIRLNQRQGEPWNVTDYTPWGGENFNPGARSSTFSAPAILNAPYLQRPVGSGSNPSTFADLTPNCDFARRNASQCQFENTWGKIQPHSQNVNAIASVTGNLGGDWRLNVVGSYFSSLSSQDIQPAVFSVGSFAGITSIGPNQGASIKNPVPNFTVPANYPGNPFGGPANIRAIVPDQIERSNRFDTGTSRLVAQLTGSAWGWDITGAAGWTNVRSNVTYRGYIAPVNAAAALNDPVNPYLLTGGNSSALQQYVTPDVNAAIWNNLSFAQVSASHDLMQLQGGPLSIAVGVGDVYNNLAWNNPGAIQNGTVNLGGAGSAYAVGSQNNFNAYVELVAPVLKNLEIDAALRYDQYNVPSNTTWNPKLGVKWTPVQQLALRGTAGTGFRAPYITESGNAGTIFNFNSIRDPQLCPVSNPDGSPNMQSPQNAVGPLNYCNFNPPYLQGVSKTLEPEKSSNYTAGFVLEPVKGWSTTFDYYYIKVKNQIVSASTIAGYQPLDNAVRSTPQIVTFGNGSTGLSSVGPIAYVNTPFVNANQTTTTGFDLGTGYTWELPDTSKLLTSVQWSHILSWDLTANGVKYELAGTHGPSGVSGDTGNPRDRAQAVFQWTKGPFTATATINYVGGYNVTDPSDGGFTCQDQLASIGNESGRWPSGVAPNYCNVASFTYTNLNFQYAMNKEWTLLASVQNVFNAKAPNDFETYGSLFGSTPNAVNNGTLLNPSMHLAGAVGPFISVGFIYQFH